MNFLPLPLRNWAMLVAVSMFLLTCVSASAADDRTNQFLGIYPVFIFWAGNDKCSYEFVLDGTGGDAGEEMRDVSVSMSGTSETGKKLGTLSFHIAAIGGSDAARYGHASAEGECGIHTFILLKATGKIDGQPVDLIKDDVVDISRTTPPPVLVIPGQNQPQAPAASATTASKPAAAPAQIASQPAASQSDPGGSLKSKLKGLFGMASLLPCNSPDLRNQVEEAIEKDLNQRNLLTRDVENSIYSAAGSLHEMTSPKAKEIASHYGDDLSKVLVCETHPMTILGQESVIALAEFINPNTKKIGAEITGYLDDADTTFGSIEGLHDEQ